MTGRIELATSDAEIAACWPVMAELRDMAEGDFVACILAQMAEGYRLAAHSDEVGAITSVAGFRIQSVLHAGRVLRLEDIVTRSTDRSKGYGDLMIKWLTAHAKAEGCSQVHVDSGTHRTAAHRFYLAHGMMLASYQFVMVLPE